MADVTVPGATSSRPRPTRTRVPAHAQAPTNFSVAEDFMSKVIDLMSPHERLALRLRHGDGLDEGAIAARMNLPRAIVRDLLRRGELTIRAAQLAFIEAVGEHSAAPAR